jgi:ribonuclease M5
VIHIKEAVVVEGKYDKIRLSSLIDGLILETNGFGIFKDKERLEMIRQVARKQGIVVLTDSDGAGFLIRSKLSSVIPPDCIKHAYIPDILGKERRKKSPSKEGKLGVEGMETEILQRALEQAGIQVEDRPFSPAEKITKADLFSLGLSGGADSSRKRQRLLQHLGLPQHLSPNGLLGVVSRLYTKEAFTALCKELEQEETEHGTD